MRHAVRGLGLARPLPTLRLRTAGQTTAFGQNIAAMANISSASRANGKPNHWHGAGAAEFDMRSEWLRCLGWCPGSRVSRVVRRLKPPGNRR